jgi:hypothetical protein
MPDSWSNTEVELIIADYFSMLSSELVGKNYSKAEHRKHIIPLLNHRSEGSVEFKHQNISAVLINLGQPFIKGYLPRFNYQKILEDKVLDFLIQNIEIEKHFKQFADKEDLTYKIPLNFEEFIIEPPNSGIFKEPIAIYERNPIKVNYLEREQKNSKLGYVGEEIVLNYEKWYLQTIGKENYGDQVIWISKEQGDGAGFDILSRNQNGTDKYIEVKTTKLTKETPIYFSRNELEFSIKHSKDYHLYRLFNIEEKPRMFKKNGDLNSICYSIPLTYRGYF